MTGSVFSCCGGEAGDAILWEPIAMRRAEFWMVWSFGIEEIEKLVNKVRAEYVTEIS